MKYFLSLLIAASCMLAVSCGFNATAVSSLPQNTPVSQNRSISNQNTPGNTPEVVPATPCQKWKGLYDELSPDDKRSLKKEGIINSPNGYVASYLLSPDLVKNCDLRFKIAEIIGEGMGEETHEEHKKFAAGNSREIVRVIRHIWNSRNFSYDGTTHEKYMLLAGNPGITNEAIAPFFEHLLKTEGLNPSMAESGLFWAFYARPLSSLDSVIAAYLKKARKQGDLTGQVYALYLLHRDTSKPRYLAGLRTILKNAKISAGRKAELAKIIDKIEQGIEPAYLDFEDFAYTVDNNGY